MSDIQPTSLTLWQLLAGRLFQIPDYQRSYSWTARQRRDLFDDIKTLMSRDSSESHFMATVVCLRRRTIQLGTDIYQRLDVVDGQQRLTTIILLLNAIMLALDSQERILRELKEMLVKPDGDNLLLLQTNHDSSHHYSNFIRSGTTDTL